MVRVIFGIFGRSRAGNLKRALVEDSESAVDAVVQRLGYDAMSVLPQGLERAYSTVRVPCSVALTCVFSVATTRVR